MSYVVLARKWRPQTFDEIVGQEHVTTTLKNSIEAGRIAHAYLFSGPRGVGKTSTARILSKAMNCQEGPTPTPCLECISCKEIAAGKSLDILEIDGASNRGIDEIRNLRANIGFAPAAGRYKVYIIDEVHMLTTEAFNALLKTLEEPPSHVKFIFATTQPHKVLATILSRCQRFDFRRISVNELVEKLQEIVVQEKIKTSPEALLYIARAADGSMRDAESVLDQLISFCDGKIEAVDVTVMLGMVSQDIFIQLTQAVIERDSATALKIVDDLINEGKDISQFLSGLIEHFRNIMVAKVGTQVQELIDLPEDRVKKLTELSQEFSFEEIFFIFSILSQAEYNIKRSNLIRSPLEMAIIKITRLDSLTSVPEMLEKLSALEQKITGSSVKHISGSSVSLPPRSAQTATVPKPGTVNTPATDQLAGGRTRDVSAGAEVKRKPAVQQTGLNLAQISKNWSNILEALGTKSPSCSAYLAGGKPVRYEQGTLFIRFGQGNGLHKSTLEDLKNKQLLHDALEKILGADVKTAFIMAGSDGDKWSSEDLEQFDESPNNQNPAPRTVGAESKDVEPIVKTAARMFKASQIKIEK